MASVGLFNCGKKGSKFITMDFELDLKKKSKTFCSLPFPQRFLCCRIISHTLKCCRDRLLTLSNTARRLPETSLFCTLRFRHLSWILTTWLSVENKYGCVWVLASSLPSNVNTLRYYEARSLTLRIAFAFLWSGSIFKTLVKHWNACSS